MADFSQRFADLLKAKFPCIYIPTWEEERVLSEIRAVCANPEQVKTPRAVLSWGITTGLQKEKEAASEDTKAPLKALELVERYDKAAVFVFKDFHVFLGAQNRPSDAPVVRRIRDLIPRLKEKAPAKSLVFVSPTLALPVELQKDVTVLEFEPPSFEDIRNLLKDVVAANLRTGRIAIDLAPDDEERLAKAALGLTLQEAENAFARAMVDDGRLDRKDVRVVLEEKRQIIRKTETLEFILAETEMGEIGGLENLKRWLRKRDKSWLEAASRYSLPPPKGVLITGVPGCGKSLLAKAVGSAWQLPILRLDVGRIFSGIVGSSEENMRLTIRTAEALAPCVLWIDEIEKGFSGIGSSGDSGTATRIFGTFLTWMQEKTKPVFVIATANNIRALPTEFLRKGRFDEIFFVDLPTKKERIEIFGVHLRRRLRDPKVLGEFKVAPDTLDRLADLSEGFIGAEIEQAVIAALFDAFAEDRAICFQDFERAIRNTVPLSVTQAEQIRELRQWANVRAVAATSFEDRVGSQPGSAASGSDARAERGGRTVDF